MWTLDDIRRLDYIVRIRCVPESMDARVRIEPFGEVLAARPEETVLAALLCQGRFVRDGCKHASSPGVKRRMVLP